MTNRSSHNPWRILLGLALAGLLGHCAGLAAEFQLILKNGDRIGGRVISEDTNRVVLTNAVLGRIVVPVGEISQRILRLPEARPAPAIDSTLQRKLDEARTAYVTGLITSAEYYRQRARLLAQASISQPAAVAAVPLTPAGAPATPGVLAPASSLMKFSGEIQAGMDLALATKDRQLYSGRGKLQHAWSRWRNSADYLFTYGRTDGELSANRMDGTVKSDYDLTRLYYGYNQGNAGYDELRKLDNYWQVGPGAGWRAIKGTNLVLNFEAGMNFEQQNRSDGTETDTLYYRLAEHGKWVLNSRFTLDQKLEYFPQWDDFSEYKIRFETTLKLWVYSNLSLNLTLIDLYDTMSARGVEPNDLQIRSTIGVRF